jgi:hypothetical protein
MRDFIHKKDKSDAECRQHQRLVTVSPQDRPPRSGGKRRYNARAHAEELDQKKREL